MVVGPCPIQLWSSSRLLSLRTSARPFPRPPRAGTPVCPRRGDSASARPLLHATGPEPVAHAPLVVAQARAGGSKLAPEVVRGRYRQVGSPGLTPQAAIPDRPAPGRAPPLVPEQLGVRPELGAR